MHEKGALPKAYLRISPDLDQHEDPLTMLRLICAAHRQPERGRFRGDANLVRALGRKKFQQAVARGDLARCGMDHWYLVGWDEWQEGDLTVGERMKRLRERRRNGNVPVAGAARTQLWRFRTEVFRRDEFVCRYCGATAYDREMLVVDHVIPDGPDSLDNLVTACRPCNIRKGARTPDAAGMVLHDVGYKSQDPAGDSPRVARVTSHK